MISNDRRHPITSFVPPRYRNAKLDDLDNRIQAMIAGNSKDGLLLHGPTGRGKTYAMAAIANMTREKGDLAALNWVDWAEFCRDVRKHWAFKTPDDQRAFDPFSWAKRQPMLFVDDLGQEQDDRGAEFFGGVVMDRYNEGRSICVTTNLAPDELELKYGGRISSRLNEMCLVVEIGSSLPDYRLA